MMKPKTLLQLILWNKILAGFVLLVLFRQQPDEERALNQAMTSVAGYAIGFLLASGFVFVGIWAASFLVSKTVKIHLSIYLGGLFLMAIGLLSFLALVCMQLVEVLAKDNPGAAWSTVIFVVLCAGLSCILALIVVLFAFIRGHRNDDDRSNGQQEFV